MNYLEIKLFQFVIWVLKRGYGADCRTSDLDDFKNKDIPAKARCGSCRAKEVIAFLEDHIDLLRM